jgi:hypothetical protein
MVLVIRGLNDDLLDLKLLPYLLGFRVGMTANGVTANGALCGGVKLFLQRGRSRDLGVAGRIDEKEIVIVDVRPLPRSKTHVA